LRRKTYEKIYSYTFNRRLGYGRAAYKGGKDFTRGSGADVKKFVEGLLK
jgi:hypothetical protein